MSELLEELEQVEQFQVTDDQKADWCLQKIAEADAELEKLTAWYQRQIDLAKEHHESRVSYFTELLKKYFSTVPAKETKTMSKYSLPSGELIMSKAKEDFKATDKEKLLSWCITNDPELIKVESSPKWAEIKKRLTIVEGKIVDNETGLFVDGVELEEKPEEFKVKARA